MQPDHNSRQATVLALASAEAARDWKRVRRLLQALGEIESESQPCCAREAPSEIIEPAPQTEAVPATIVIEAGS